MSTRRKKINRKSQLFFRTLFVVSLIIAIFICVKFIYTDKNDLRAQGITAFKEGNYDASIAYFDKALACKQLFSEGTDADIMLYKADALMHLSAYKQAADCYYDLASNYDEQYFDKDKVAFLCLLAGALDRYSAGSYTDEISIFESAVDRGYTEISYYVADCYDRQGDTDKMLEYLDIYTKEYGMTPELAYKYAYVYVAKEDYKKALSYIEPQLNNSSEYTDALRYYQVLCYTGLCEYEKAYELVASYLKTSESTKLKELYDYLDTRVNVNEHIVNDIYNLNKDSGGKTPMAVE